MLTGDQYPATIRVDLDVAFQNGIEGVLDPSFRQLLEVIPTMSTAKQEVFYGDRQRLRRFRAERQPRTVNEYKQLITADEWELTHNVKASVLEDDQSGQILTNRITNFGTEVERSKMKEFWEYFRNGSSIMGFDKARFFDFNHRYVTSSGVTISAVAAQANMHLGGSGLDATTIQIIKRAISNFVSDTNQKLGSRLTHVVVYQDSDNHKNAMELANSQFTVQVATAKGANTVNVFKGSFDIISTQYGLGETEWIALDLSDSNRKPVKVLSHVKNGFDNEEFSQLDLESDNGFWRRELAYGVYGRWDYNPGYWMTSYLVGTSNYTFTPDDFENQRALYPNV